MTKTEKQEKVELLIKNVNEGLENHAIKEQPIGLSFRCDMCIMVDDCVRNIKNPCMAHNRKDKQGIYYINRN